MKIKLNSFLLLFPLFFSAVLLNARDIAITVIDQDLNLPLEGAVIRSWDGAEHICDENGIAVIQAPENRQVIIQAGYPGYETGRLVISVSENSYTLALRLSGIMENKELVIEAAKPGTSETRTGRSVAISAREIAQTAEIGVIEDVMSSVKLLPGVGFTGLFNAQPSIRGGDPGDMRASLDGYYILNPYHWGGGFSIFDPRMAESAQLSHGVFSTRYGHSISGLLEITAKKPSYTDIQIDIGLNTSAANLNLSVPVSGKGGILFMGRVTYYDPVVALAKELSKTFPAIDLINSVRVPPYIRSGTVTGNYRFTGDLELKAAGFWGMDGVGASYRNLSDTSSLRSNTSADFDFINYQGFFNTALSWNPRNDMLLKFTAGTGYEKSDVNGDMRFDIYSRSFMLTENNTWYYNMLQSLYDDESYDFYTRSYMEQTDLAVNAQSRVDYDWELGKGFLLAAGVQEMFTYYKTSGRQQDHIEKNLRSFDEQTQEELFLQMGITDPALKDFLRRYLIISMPVNYNPDTDNKLFTTSGYSLAEYSSKDNRFRAELGLRLDHFYLTGKDFSHQSKPVLNPRLNLDFTVFRDLGIFKSLDIGAGTGLFSSMNNSVYIAENEYEIDELKPNRSWTSVLGTRLELQSGLIFNIEGYFKYNFDRMYIPINAGLNNLEIRPQFNGEGKIWGIDVLIQKLQSRYWDGWISYSWLWVKYRDPDSGRADMGISGGTRGNEWYFPDFHRFHNLNMVLNVKPVKNINIYTRFGLASGVQLSRRLTDSPDSYPVYVYDSNDPQNNKYIEIFYWRSVRDEKNRTTASLPMDIKFSIYGKNKNGKTRFEVYAAVENVLALCYTAQGNTSFNRYTGQIDRGSSSASYEMPIPIPSFGFKLSY
ncbi:MAG: TonB-dependent receptor plug domain-containing protein [Treponema sp.]|jgi:hypothetical protein|nr:TonB-dependent receptor plug domain-containing protein [Treponema sp.]